MEEVLVTERQYSRGYQPSTCTAAPAGMGLQTLVPAACISFWRIIGSQNHTSAAQPP